MNRNSNNRNSFPNRDNSVAQNRQRRHRNINESDIYESEFSRYDDGYDDNYLSPAYSMNSGNMNAGRRVDLDEGNMFRTKWNDEDAYTDGYYDLGSYRQGHNDRTYRNTSERNRRERKDDLLKESYYDKSRNRNDSYGLYGQEKDDNYSRRLGYDQGYLRDYDSFHERRRGQYTNERMNSREYDGGYDDPVSVNTGDYRYNNVGGGYNSRYNTFNDDRDYYRGFAEFEGDLLNAERWRGRRIR